MGRWKWQDLTTTNESTSDGIWSPATKVQKEDEAEYIQALIDTWETENINIFVDRMITNNIVYANS